MSVAYLDGDPQPPMSRSFDSQFLAWDRLLGHQVSLFAPAELDYLARHPDWQCAATVVDVGCGNGDYLAAVADRFPAKQYLGIDIAEPLVRLARSRHRGSRIDFAVSNGGQLVRPADVLLLRFVLQHQSDAASFLEGLASSSKSGARAIIIEPRQEACTLTPSVPTLNTLVARHTARQEGIRTGGTAWLQERAAPHWRLTRHEVLTISYRRGATWPAIALRGTLLGWVEALAPYASEEEFTGVTREIDNWASSLGQRAELALDAWTIERV